ncbi:MAG: glycosyl transferase [Prevotella sp.]|nr:glycosyl transferase [Prevotella sp.]
MKTKSLIRKITSPYKLLDKVLRMVSPLIRSDKLYSEMRYYACMRKPLHLNPPKTFNEKLQWLKLYDRHESYSKLVDKYEVKQYVGNIIGKEYIIPTYGLWEHVDDIDFDGLPDQFVIKCTHDSQSFIICPDKKAFEVDKAKKKLRKALKFNKWYYQGREYPYKNVQPRIIAEQYLVDESGTELKDYKFFCFDGEPKVLLIVSGRGYNQRQDFYDMDFNLLPFHRIKHPNSGLERTPPENFDQMVELAKVLSKGFPHIRVDFYNVSGKIFFGELTFFSGGGNTRFEPDEWDGILGSWINLPKAQN